MVRKISALLLIVMLFALTACGVKLPDISEYGDTAITIVGLTDEEFTVTPNELSQLTLTNGKATGSNAIGASASLSGIGPTLTEFFAQYDKAPENFTLVRFIASDEYRITLHEKTLVNSDKIILSIASGKNPLPGSEQPLRLLIPGADSSQWIYAVVRIEFEPVEG
jgi:hypothetical protein